MEKFTIRGCENTQKDVQEDGPKCITLINIVTQLK